MTDVTRDLPWSENAEQSVLGALLVKNEVWFHVLDILSVEKFFAHPHRLIFTAIGQLIGMNRPADVITVHDRLVSQDKLVEAGGLQYLHAVASCVPSAAHARRYAEIVAEKALRRALLETADEVRVAALGDGEAAQIANDCTTMFLKLQQDGVRQESESIGDVLMRRIDHYNDLAQGKVLPGLSTGYEDLDKALSGGMRPGKVIVIAARPGIGKTALSLSILLNAAKADQFGLFLSQEMDKGSLVDRAIANVGAISYGNLLTGKLTEREWGRLAEASDKVGHLPIHLDEQAGLTINMIRAKAIRHKRNGLRVLVIDYLQLCKATGQSKRENRDQQLGEISREIKAMAKDLGITVLLLSQLNREVEKRGTNKPNLSDLRESGAIEQDADMVLMLWPIRYEGTHVTVGAYAPKNREGTPNTEWTWKFQGYWQRFSKAEEDTAHGGYTPGSGGFDN